MLVNLKEILKIAEDTKTAAGMFNATGLDSIQAVISAAEELDVPVILAHAEVHNIYNDIGLVAPVMLSEARRAKVPVCVHLDHGVTFGMIHRALRLGFTSVMYDASHLTYEENINGTCRVVQMAKDMGVSVEAELGRLVSGESGGDEGGNVDPSAFYTVPEQAAGFVERTGIDALAIAFGTNHGFYKSKPALDFDVISNVRRITNGMPLVMHGGSGVDENSIKTAIRSGIRKINYYSYMSKAGFEAAERLIKTNSTYYYHDIAFAAMQAMKADVKKALELFSGAN